MISPLTSVPVTSFQSTLPISSDKRGHYLKITICGKEISRRLKAPDPQAAEWEAKKIVRKWKEKLRNLWLRDGVWYVTAQVDHKRISQSLQLPEADLECAQRRARALLKAACKGHWEVLDDMKLRKDFATVEEVVTVFRREAERHGLRAKTLNSYVGSLNLVLGVTGDVGTERLNKTVVRNYVEKMLDGMPAEREASVRRSARSTVRQARALFGRWAREAYEDAGLILPPTIDEFVKCYVVEADPIHYRLPARALIEATHKAALQLQEDKSDLWTVYLLVYYLALRAGEAVAARWNWVETDPDGRTWIHIVNRPGEWQGPKGTEGRVPVPDQVRKWLEESHVTTRDHAESEYILPGNLTARNDLVGRTFARWMRGLGWTTGKAAHELRKVRGSEWYTRRGLEAACAWLRHADPSTTKRYYADLTVQPKTLEVGE